MGMFTTVIDDAGVEWQFKCGWDDCDRYKVGDKVRQRVYQSEPGAGHLLDGVYHATAWKHVDPIPKVESADPANPLTEEERQKINDQFLAALESGIPSPVIVSPKPIQFPPAIELEKWVVIKDAVLVAMIDVEKDEDGEVKDGHELQETAIELRYGIVPPAPELWSDAVWAEDAKRKARYRAERRREDAETYGWPEERKARHGVSAWTRNKMKQDGFFAKLLKDVSSDEQAQQVLLSSKHVGCTEPFKIIDAPKLPEEVVTDVFLSLGAGRLPAEKLRIGWDDLRNQKAWLAGAGGDDPDPAESECIEGLLNFFDGFMDAAVALGVPVKTVFGPEFAEPESDAKVPPSQGGCWYCQEECSSNGVMMFCQEFDTYMHKDCFEAELLKHAAGPHDNRELMIIAAEFNAKVVDGRVVYGNHEETKEQNDG